MNPGCGYSPHKPKVPGDTYNYTHLGGELNGPRTAEPGNTWPLCHGFRLGITKSTAPWLLLSAPDIRPRPCDPLLGLQLVVCLAESPLRYEAQETEAATSLAG